MKYLLIFAATLTVAHCTSYSNVYFKFIGTGLNDVVTKTYGDNWSSLANSVYFNSNKKTMFYINSFRQNFNSFDVSVIFTPYLSSTRRSEWNLIYVDYSNYTDNFVFVPTLQALGGIGAFAARIIFNMQETFYPGLFPSGMYYHIIGFGLGAHLGGVIGRNIKINRITGLDPLGVLSYTSVMFTFAGVKELNFLDAQQVDIIHTSAGKFGIGVASGHLDFWPNGGSTQIGCTFLQSLKDFLKDQRLENIYTLASSHTRAIYYYAESVGRSSTSKPFLSAMCNPMAPACDATHCTNTNNRVSMGYHAVVPTCGVFNALDCTSPNYFLKTNAASPFSRD